MMLMNIVAIALASLMKRKTKPTRERERRKKKEDAEKNPSSKHLTTTLHFHLLGVFFSLPFFFASSLFFALLLPSIFPYVLHDKENATLASVDRPL